MDLWSLRIACREGKEPLNVGVPTDQVDNPEGSLDIDDDMEVDALFLPSYDSLDRLPCRVSEEFLDKIDKASVFQSIEEHGWVKLKMRDRVVYLQRPSFVRDDATNESLDLDKATKGLTKEIRGLDSLKEIPSPKPRPMSTARHTRSRSCPRDGCQLGRRMVRRRKTSFERALWRETTLVGRPQQQS